MYQSKMSPLDLPCTTERKTIRQVFTTKGKRDVRYVDITDTYDRSWDCIFKNHEYTIEQLLETLYRNGYSCGMKVFPYPSEVLSAFTVPIDKVKVIIIGQDPYPGWDTTMNRPVACGKTFATYSKECPGSLKRIMIALQELRKDIKFTFSDKEHPFCLKGWTDQGVLLLNKTPVYYHAISTDPDKEAPTPNTKASDIWAGMTELICKQVAAINPNVPCILVGKEAQTLEPKLGGRCYKENHPSMRSSLEFSGTSFDKIDGVDWSIL